MRFLLAPLFALLLPLAAAAQSLEWAPPEPGTRMAYELLLGTERIPTSIEVLAVEGDLVRSRVDTGGSLSEELSLRGVVNLESASGSFDFDLDEARALWPLEVGRSVAFDGTGMASGMPIRFSAALSVEAIEQVETPAGTFQAARIANRTAMTIEGTEIVLETQQWLDAASGLPVQTSIAISSGGQLVQTLTMTAVEGPTAP